MLRGILCTFVFAGLLTASVGSLWGQPPKLNKDTAALVKDNNAFAFDLYAQLRQKDGDLFYSPYSISSALGMTYGGARGDTAAEMANAMRFDLDQQRLHPAFADLRQQLQAKNRNYKLEVANRLWGQQNFQFLPDFLKLTKTHYGAGLEPVDFAGNTEQARLVINEWVEKQTNDKIKELLKPGILNEYTRLVLTNAIYFKASWMQPFNAKQTRDVDFHVSADKKIKVPMMHQSLRTRYYNGGQFHMVELPYEEFDLSMVVIMPTKVGDLTALEKGLTGENVAKWLAKLSDHQVELALPKFKTTSELSMKETLQKMGMKLAFLPREADFSGMSTEDKLHIQAVIHKAFVDVNEAGTEAAASTAVVVGIDSLPPPATFVANHPFVYLIRDNRTGSILFVGRQTFSQ